MAVGAPVGRADHGGAARRRCLAARRAHGACALADSGDGGLTAFRNGATRRGATQSDRGSNHSIRFCMVATSPTALSRCASSSPAGQSGGGAGEGECIDEMAGLGQAVAERQQQFEPSGGEVRVFGVLECGGQVDGLKVCS